MTRQRGTNQLSSRTFGRSLGRWFDPLRGIVPDPRKSERVVLYRGREEAARTLERMRRKWAIGAAVSMLVASVIVILFFTEVELLHSFAQTLRD